MSNSAFYKVHAFGTPNAMTPSTIENNGNNENGYVQNFGALIISGASEYLVVNGTPSTQLGITSVPDIRTEFYVPKAGIIKKVVIRIELPLPSVFFTLYVNGVATTPIYYPTQTPNLTPSYNMYNTNIYLNTGDYVTVLSSCIGHTFVSLYIE